MIIIMYYTSYYDITTAHQDSFNITEGVDGSALSYTISYSDSVSGINCHSTTISASSCDDGICSDVFEASASLCPPLTDITVTVFATNILGNGPTSIPKNIGRDRSKK